MNVQLLDETLYLSVKQAVNACIIETCRQHLKYHSDLHVQGFLWITIDKTSVLLISINEVSLVLYAMIF